MNSIYQYTSYRELLKDQAAAWKKEHAGWTLQRIAEKASLQPPYLTNVLKGRAHLSSDQFHALGQIFNWDGEESDYGILLLEWERSGLSPRKEALKKRIDEIRKLKTQSSHTLKKQVINPTHEEYLPFYLNPFYSLINSFLGVKRFSIDPKKISRCLNLDVAQVQSWLKELVRMKFVESTPQGFVKLKKNFHLPIESPLCEPHLAVMQQATSQHLQTLPQNEKVAFNLTFSADPETKEKIHREFVAFLKRIEPMVKDAPAEELYGLRFDLFRWSFEKSGG